MILFLAFRNFIRQRRRNLLLGTAIAFGVMVLTIAFSFTAGLTDTLLNRVVIFISGHIQVNVIENGRMMSPIIRDRQKWREILTSTLHEVTQINDVIGTYCRAIGNGKADYVYLTGLQLTPDFKATFQLKYGQFSDFSNPKINNPILLSEEKAKALNVKVGDQISIRLITVNGQQNTGTMTVVGILHSQNVWMDFAVFTPLTSIKSLAGYLPHESGALQVILKNPKNAAAQADALWQKLRPPIAYIQTETSTHLPVILVAATADAPPTAWTTNHDGALISQPFATQHHLKIGGTLRFLLHSKFGTSGEETLTITTINTYPTGMASNVIILDRDHFFTAFNHYLPQNDLPLSHWIPETSLQKSIATQWLLMPRTHTTETYTANLKKILRTPQAQSIVTVASMYEVASTIVSTENALNLSALIGASILLLIIMVGVLNSLQMTIRERTHEIGTMRAIGMKQREILALFMTESLLLAIAGWVVGTLGASLVIQLLQLLQFGVDNPLNMIMAHRHLYFLVSIPRSIEILGLLLIFMAITSYFPARRAAKLSPAIAFGQLKG